MASTDIDGSPILIISRAEAETALEAILRRPYRDLKPIELQLASKIQRFLGETK
jgi:hypothetical protein